MALSKRNQSQELRSDQLTRTGQNKVSKKCVNNLLKYMKKKHTLCVRAGQKESLQKESNIKKWLTFLANKLWLVDICKSSVTLL